MLQKKPLVISGFFFGRGLGGMQVTAVLSEREHVLSPPLRRRLKPC